MKTSDENETVDDNANNQFEALSQEFNGGGFYGLEYILEDFFQGTAAKPVRTRPTVDWFGLYG